MQWTKVAVTARARRQLSPRRSTGKAALVGRESVCKEPFYCDSFTCLSPEVVSETGQFYPSSTIVHYRLSKKTPFRVNHQIQDEKVLICKSAQVFLFRAGDGREGTHVPAAASPLGQVHWQAHCAGAGRMHPAFIGTFVTPWGPGCECLIWGRKEWDGASDSGVLKRVELSQSMSDRLTSTEIYV